MNKAEAHRLLDGARAGLPISQESISEALQATGDLDAGWRRPEQAEPGQMLPFEHPRFWQPRLQPEAQSLST